MAKRTRRVAALNFVVQLLSTSYSSCTCSGKLVQCHAGVSTWLVPWDAPRRWDETHIGWICQYVWIPVGMEAASWCTHPFKQMQTPGHDSWVTKGRARFGGEICEGVGREGSVLWHGFCDSCRVANSKSNLIKCARKLYISFQPCSFRQAWIQTGR